MQRPARLSIVLVGSLVLSLVLVLLPNDVTAKPIGPDVVGQEHQSYLPLIMKQYPRRISYGPKGVGDPWQNSTPPNPHSNLDVLEYDWFYDWQFNYVPDRSEDLRYVRMVWCGATTLSNRAGVTKSVAEVARGDYIGGRQGRVWLVLNEPDYRGQCGTNEIPTYGGHFLDYPERAARYFSGVYDMIKANDPYARVFGGGMVWPSSADTRHWWSIFIDTLAADGDLYKLEGVHVHLYPEYSTSDARRAERCVLSPDCVVDLAQAANTWYEEMHRGKGLGDRPIWITEFGWLFCGGESPTRLRDTFLEPMTHWFDGSPAWPHAPDIPTNPGYDAISWFTTFYQVDRCYELLEDVGSGRQVTALGQFWNDYRLQVR